MAITSLDTYINSAKQKLRFVKTTVRTTIATAWFSLFDVAGEPGAGTLAVGNTANGLVPTDAVTGFPFISAFGGAAKGYLSIVEFGSTVASRLRICDRLFHAGAYAFNANTTLASQPSYSSRIPGADYKGTEIWIECVTAFTGNLSVAVTYTNQDGTASRSTGTFATGTALTLGRMMQLPLQAGDTGVQKIDSVIGTVATGGTFNVLVLRPLWGGRIMILNGGDTHGLDKTGMPELFADSALQILVNADSTSTGIPELLMEIANG
ncbi:MAG: hypothetical protein ABIR78_05955 [Ferruginibacter sp.]